MGKTEDKKNLFLKSWDSLRKSKAVGGLVFCQMEDTNKALMAEVSMEFADWGRQTMGENAHVKILERHILQGN